MLNKKGMTLLEIIISIALISVVMLFLFSLLNDIQYESKHSSYAKDFLVSRATIIKDVQEDILNNNITNVMQVSAGEGKVNLNFFRDDTSLMSIEVESKKITYKNAAGEKESFSLSEDNDDEVFDFNHIKVSNYEGNKIYKPIDTDGDGVCNVNCGDNSTKNDDYAIEPDFKYYHVIIPVLTGASDNAIDDLEFFFLVKK
ncbi:prepilin-type N-terminal cleavage/methylation domain-containing protein [bacterium]|nr:prepilin-type N-terminal cleavage/methylation domain-containing protein [bacterium]